MAMFEWFEEEVRSLERRRRFARAKVVFYGSSSIRLWTTLEADFPLIAPVNLGFGGSTLAACVHFFDRLVTPEDPMRALVFYAGDNDIGDGRPVGAVVDSFRYLHDFVDKHLAPETPFGFIGIKPSVARWDKIDRIRAVNAAVRAEIATRPQSAYIDLEPVMLDAGGGPRAELFVDDGLHLSPAGYAVWRDVVGGWLSGVPGIERP